MFTLMKPSMQHIISLAVIVISIVLFVTFPSDNIYQQITGIIAFLIVLPIAYTRIILGSTVDIRSMLTWNISRKSLLTFLLATGSGIVLLNLLHLTPYDEPYVTTVQSVIFTFKGFLIYELLFVLPLLAIVLLFTGPILASFHLPGTYFFFVRVVVASFFLMLLLNMSIFTILFVGIMFFIYYQNKEITYLPVLLSFFISTLSLDVVIAKSLQ